MRCTILGLCAFFLVSAPARAQESDRVALTILHTNDLHGQFVPFEDANSPVPRGGAVAIIEAIERYRKLDPSSLLVSAGDWFDGSPEALMTRGKLIIDFFNEAGYAASGLGDADFALGENALQELCRLARFPVFCANVVERDGKTPKPYLAAGRIFNVKGVSVGISGVTTVDAPAGSLRKNFENVLILDDAAAMRREIKALRDQGAEIVIMLNHLGPIRNQLLAKLAPGADLIVGGHVHTAALPQGATTPERTFIVQSTKFGITLGVVQIVFDRKKKKVVEIGAKLELLDATEGEGHPVVDRLHEQYGASFRELETVVSNLPEALDPKAEKHVTSSLGNWLADGMRFANDAEIAFFYRDSSRDGLPAGEVKVKDILRAFPVGNDSIVTCTASGKQILDSLQSVMSSTSSAGVEFSGMKVKLIAGLATVFQEHVTIGGKPLEPEREYRVVTSSYAFEDRTGMVGLQKSKSIEDTEVYLRFAVRSLVESGKAPPIDGVSRFEVLGDADAVAELVRLVSSDASATRRKAISSLARLGDPGKSALDEIIRTSPHIEVRAAARAALDRAANERE